MAELRAARGWSLKQTADTFLVTPATIASWVKRIDDQGPDAVSQLREHRGPRKRVLENLTLKDTIRTMDSEGYGSIGEHKDSVDQDTSNSL